MTENSTLGDYLELARLPNAFTAMADPLAGFLIVQPLAAPRELWQNACTLGLLLAASAMLYTAGVVLNDVFDLDVDRRQRPERPLPSGRISLRAARRLGWTLLTLGVLLGVGAMVVAFGGGIFSEHLGSAAAAPLLAATILLYDAWLKRTPIGPAAMGLCRSLNVVLGLSAAGVQLPTDAWLIAGGLGVYVAGVTWFARTEAGRSRRLPLLGAITIMTLGIAMLAWAPFRADADRLTPLLREQPGRWWLLMSLLGASIVGRCLWAVVEPVPARVRMAVARCVLSIVVLDAAACYAFRDVFCAGLILALLLPAVVLNRWMEMT